MSYIKNQLPQILLIITSLIMIIPYFINSPPLENTVSSVNSMIVPIVAAGIMLGSFSLLMHHSNTILKQQKNFPFSIVLIVSFLFFAIVNLIPGLENIATYSFVNVIGKVNEAMFSVIVPFLVTMAFRGFRVKNFNSLLFTLTCLVILIANPPIGEVISPVFPQIRNWIQNVPNLAGMRAVNIGVAIGIFGYAVRTLLGIERIGLGEFMAKIKSKVIKNE